MKIAFIHHQAAFLPELAAYQTFFQQQHIESMVVMNGQQPGSDADVHWYFMGWFPGIPDKRKIIIHEYASASVPPYRKLKDFFKSRLNARPHFRLYLNEYVREQINIHDETPFGYRDMGIGDHFLRTPGSSEKIYDFIYTGNLSPHRNLDRLLKIFEQGALENHSVLLLGSNGEKLKDHFSHCKNIFFHPAVDWAMVPGFIEKSRYALNYIPDEEPFNAQTSTKFLEYAAMKIPVVSSNYFWISEFQERYGGNYFLLKDDLSNMSWPRIKVFPYAFPDLQSWRWEERIKASGVLEFLRQSGIE